MGTRCHRKVQVGDRFGRLVILELGERAGATEYFDRCRCDCGAVVQVRRGLMQSGNTKSCGCLATDWQNGGFGKWLTKHGRSRTKFYVWWNSHRRSERTLVPGWRKDFAVLLAEVGDRMEEGLHPFRPDRLAAYGPGNFEWRR